MASEDPFTAPGIDMNQIREAQPLLYWRPRAVSYLISQGRDPDTDQLMSLMGELRRVYEEITTQPATEEEKPEPSTIHERIWKCAPAPLVDTKPVYVPKFQLSEHDRAQLHQAFSRKPNAQAECSFVVSSTGEKLKVLEIKKGGKTVWKPVPGRGWQQV